MVDRVSSGAVARTYDRIAGLYDWLNAPMERMGGDTRRARMIGGARGRILEIGVGTGRNLPLYAADTEVTAVDISLGMLARARSRAAQSQARVELQQADVELLPFPDATFDTITATCVFCSVGDPVRGLEEVARVVKPDGEVRLLEHVRPRGRLLGHVFDLLSPLTRRLMGPEINRRTEENVLRAGLAITGIRRDGIWREIEARPRDPGGVARS